MNKKRKAYCRQILLPLSAAIDISILMLEHCENRLHSLLAVKKFFFTARRDNEYLSHAAICSNGITLGFYPRDDGGIKRETSKDIAVVYRCCKCTEENFEKLNETINNLLENRIKEMIPIMVILGV